jgi:hypothetical protein
LRWLLGLGLLVAFTLVCVGVLYASHRLLELAWWLLALIVLAVVLAIWLLVGKAVLRLWRGLALSKKFLPIALFLVFFAVSAFFALAWQTEQRSDFLEMYRAAELINLGDFSFNQKAYWHFFAYQTPFTIYEAFMLKLFGPSLVPLLLVNAAAMAGSNLLVYLFTRRVTGSAVAGLFASFGYLIYTGQYLQANALTSDHLSTLGLYLGVYLVLTAITRLPQPRAWLVVGLGGLIAGLGNLARPAGIVVMVALTGTLILVPVMRRAKAESWRKVGWTALAAVLTLAVYVGTGQAAGQAIQASGINPAGASNNLPEWKFVLGLRGQGDTNPPIDEIGAYLPQPKPDARETAQRALRNNIHQLPDTWVWIIARQVTSMWGLNNTAYFMFWPQLSSQGVYAMPDRQSATVAHYLVRWERALFLPTVLLAAMGGLMLTRQRRWDYLAAFLGCFVIAFVAAHLVIEVQPRYRYLAMPAIFCLTGPVWAWATSHRKRFGLAR